MIGTFNFWDIGIVHPAAVAVNSLNSKEIRVLIDATPSPGDQPLQPLLHDLISLVRAPACALSGEDGQIRETGVQGVFNADLRVLSQAVLKVDGREPEPLGSHHEGAGGARFVSVIRWASDPTPDPTLRLTRLRQVTSAGMTETIQLHSTARRPITLALTLDLACDLASSEAVKTGFSAPRQAAVTESSGARLAWRLDGVHVAVTSPDALLEDGDKPRLSWNVTVPPRQPVSVTWTLSVSDARSVMAAPAGQARWSAAEVRADDRRITRLFAQSLDDLESLRLVEPTAPDDVFLGAGVPWFLTLFGRDSVWAARMLLPLGTDLAAGTLRALARRQGRTLDSSTGEAPGKIMHELRRPDLHLHDANRAFKLPSAYYGTVDATMLWISLLHDAWRWGMPEQVVSPLLPNLQAALSWLEQYADPDGDGFVEYIDSLGTGLSNQGWKDSGDAVRFHDGSLAQPPIALVEVQGYAYQAAKHGAALLEGFGLPGAQRWHDYADDLSARFRAKFWVDGFLGGFPALALDRDKRPVDSLTSNIGHLLGTGILTPAESARVAELLSSPEMSDGYGLRTMSRTDGGFNPMSYHCGSVWTHDTAIAISGLAREGHFEAAAGLVEGLLLAAEAFDYRLPELHGGDSRSEVRRPMPYPAACSPQAWSAASAIAIVQAVLGLRPDVPSGRVELDPMPGAPLGALSIRGLRIAGVPVDVTVDRAGAVHTSGISSNLRVDYRTR